MLAICPGCGLDLLDDQAVTFGQLKYHPIHGLSFADVSIGLAQTESHILGTLMRAPNQVFAKYVLAERVDVSETADLKVIDVYLCRIRKALAAYELRHTVRTVWGRGVYFDPTGIN